MGRCVTAVLSNRPKRPDTCLFLLAKPSPAQNLRSPLAMAAASYLGRTPWAAATAAARSLLAARIRGVHAPHSLLRCTECPAPFSSLSTRPQGNAAAVDAQLLRVINYEISCAQQDCKKRDWVCDFYYCPSHLFPVLFGSSFLAKRDQKEQIELEVFLPSPANPDELIIESLAFGHSDDSVSLSSVEAKLSNFPKELQKAFYSYLRSRGISKDVTNFLHAYMINKECHEYLSWLRKIKSLIRS